MSKIIYSFSVHVLHIGGVLLDLLPAAVLAVMDCGREEHREQVTKVEKVDTDNSAALGPILVIFDVLESTEHDTGIDNITLNVVILTYLS